MHAVIVATDMPWAAPLIVRLMTRFPPTGADALIPVDADGRDQPLCSAWNTTALRRALAEVGDPRGASVRALVSHASVASWQLDTDESALLADIDCPADLAAAQQPPHRRRLDS
jgi:molybdopterin-guanine dinucleotide biosynthesis protein A